MDPSLLEALDQWNSFARIAGFALGGVFLAIVLIYELRLLMNSDPKAKYDFINKYEIRILWVACIFLIAAVALFLNSYIGPSEESFMILVFVRAFVTVLMALIAGVVLRNTLRFYYPFYIEKRLKKLRYKPRISPKSGKPMKLLSEEEEDVYLDEGMQAEENIFSVDYDVWVDEETGYTKIEKYAGHLHAELSPDSGYYTLKVVKEEIVKPPTYDEEGLLIKYYEDVYSGYKEKRECVIAKLSKSSAGDKVLE
ncbi:MAG: hypothetical protein AAFX87_28605 [Bacteroidota bacterium]